MSGATAWRFAFQRLLCDRLMRALPFENLWTGCGECVWWFQLPAPPHYLPSVPLRRDDAHCWCSSSFGSRPGTRHKERIVPSCTRPIILSVRACLQARSHVTLIKLFCEKKWNCAWNTRRSPTSTRILAFMDQLSALAIEEDTPQPT